MSERKSQTKYVPLRVRFRTAAEALSTEREHAHISREDLQGGTEPLVPDLSEFSDAQRRTQQIKELVRLGALLRADLKLDTILQQFAASIAACTGFRVLVINLFDEKRNRTIRAAFAGLSEADQSKLRAKNLRADGFPRNLPAEYRVSQSYFVPHSHGSCPDPVVSSSYANYEPGGWHPEDMLIVPFYSTRQQKMLGYLSLDDPEDSRVPTEESIEVVELFANQVALAIDNAHLMQEREEEHRALQVGIALLKEDLEELRAGHLEVQVRASHPTLQPVADAINSVTRDIKTILSNMQLVTGAVDEHTRNVQRSSELLALDTVQQQRQTEQISLALQTTSTTMNQLASYADDLAQKTNEVVEVTEHAQRSVDRAFSGMQGVREATMRSVRIMKSLGESGQEVNEAVGSMAELSMRLHLLSLNAAIEASRVGEHGQGFAVVVQEIRTLAKGCTEAARKVSDYIRTFQKETATASHSVEQGTQQVVMQTELVAQTVVSLDAIDKVTEELTELVKQVCLTVEGQEQNSQQVEQAADEISRVTGHITSHTQGIQQSLSHLVELTDTLRSRVASLHLDERQHSAR